MRIIIDQIANGFTVTLMKSPSEGDTMFISTFKEVTDHLLEMANQSQKVPANVVPMTGAE